jgi:hypothetical protein
MIDCSVGLSVDSDVYQLKIASLNLLRTDSGACVKRQCFVDQNVYHSLRILSRWPVFKRRWEQLRMMLMDESSGHRSNVCQEEPLEEI